MAEPQQHFHCSWGPCTRLVTSLVAVMVAALAVGLIWLAALNAETPFLFALHLAAAAAVVALPVAMAFFAPCCYRVTPTHLVVRRLGPHVVIPRRHIRSVEILDPEDFRESFREMGGGGFLGCFGRFHSRKLGHFMAYATRPDRALVIYTHDESYVLTPDDPQALAEALRPEDDGQAHENSPNPTPA